MLMGGGEVKVGGKNDYQPDCCNGTLFFVEKIEEFLNKILSR